MIVFIIINICFIFIIIILCKFASEFLLYKIIIYDSRIFCNLFVHNRLLGVSLPSFTVSDISSFPGQLAIVRPGAGC